MTENAESWTPYNYVFNNPILLNDPDGRWPDLGTIHTALDVAGLVPGLGEIADGTNALIYLAEGNKVGAALSAGAMIPVAGMAVTGVKFLRTADKLADAAKAADKAISAVKAVDKTSDATKPASKADSKARFIGDTDGKVIDTKATPKGSYQQPDGSRTDVLQESSHFNKRSKENHGTSHTHEAYTNINPKTGEPHTGTHRSNTHRPTAQEVKNIQTGKAKKIIE